MRLLAVEVYATCKPALSSEGSELGPSAATPLNPTLTFEVLGVQVLFEVRAAARQVFRRKTSLKPLVWFTTRLVELEAKATRFPVWFTEGPAVARVGVPPEQVAPQIPLFACVPSGARSTITDRKSTRLNSSHLGISYAVFCLK